MFRATMCPSSGADGCDFLIHTYLRCTVNHTSDWHKFTFDFHTTFSRRTKLPESASTNTAEWTWDKPQPIRDAAADFRYPDQATCCHTRGQYPVHATKWSDTRHFEPTAPLSLARSLEACPAVTITKRSVTAGTLQNATGPAKFPLVPNCLNCRRNP
jgi:hypothetical protein